MGRSTIVATGSDYGEQVIAFIAAFAVFLFRDVLTGLFKALTGGVGRWRASRKQQAAAVNQRATFEDTYRRWVAEENRFLNTRGIRFDDHVRIELDRVYVRLRLKRRNAARGPRRGFHTARFSLVSAEGEATFPFPPLPEQRKAAREFEALAEPKDTVYTLGEALSDLGRHLVILGGPGAGKTTLLRYLARTFATGGTVEGVDASFLPVLVPLRDWVRKGLGLTAENLKRYAVSDEIADDCPDDFFQRALRDGMCLLLLDGMDEVTTETQRNEVAAQIERLRSSYPDARIVVTSRPAGYEGVSLRGFSVVRVEDFRPEDVAEFARRWTKAVIFEERKPGDDSVAQGVARQEAEDEAERLVAAIEASDRVRKLAVNPLLLTVVAIVHRFRAELPKERVRLYEECLQVLLHSWDTAKARGRAQPGNDGVASRTLDWQKKRAVLASLAFAMHDDRQREWPRERVVERLREALPTVGGRPDDAVPVFETIRERSGLLVERGIDQFGFSHLTFQEYLAAIELRQRGAEGREFLIRHVEDAWWRETLLLYAGLDDATALVDDLLALDFGLFYTPLFVASEALAEAVSVRETAVVGVTERLIEEIGSGEFISRATLARDALILLAAVQACVEERVVSAIGRGSHHVDETMVWVLWHTGAATTGAREALVRSLSSPHRGTCVFAAYGLQRLGPLAEPALPQLRELARDGSVDEREAAAIAIAGLGEAGAPALEELRALLRDPEGSLRTAGAEALGEIGLGAETAVDDLFGLLDDDFGDVSYEAARALGQIGRGIPAVVERLRLLLRSRSTTMRARALDAISYLGRSAEAVQDDLLRCLLDDQDEVREAAAFALSNPEVGLAPAFGELQTQLQRGPDRVRLGAAAVLGATQAGGEAAVEDLRGLLSDDSADVRQSAVRALGRFGKTARSVETEIRSLARDDESDLVRKEASAALMDMGALPAETPYELVDLLGSQGSKVSRVGHQLGRMQEGALPVLDDLIETAAKGQPEAQIDACVALGWLASLSPRASRALIDGFTYLQDPLAGACGYGLWNACNETKRGRAGMPIMASGDIASIHSLIDSEKRVSTARSKLRVRDVAWDLLYAHHRHTSASEEGA